MTAASPCLHRSVRPVDSYRPYLEELERLVRAGAVTATQTPAYRLCAMPRACARGAASAALRVPLTRATAPGEGTCPDDALKAMVQSLVAEVAKACESTGAIFIHCSDGDGRAGVVASVLVGVLYALSGAEAMDFVQRCRDTRAGPSAQSPSSHGQRMQVHRALQDAGWVERCRATAAVREADSSHAHAPPAARWPRTLPAAVMRPRHARCPADLLCRHSPRQRRRPCRPAERQGRRRARPPVGVLDTIRSPASRRRARPP